MGGAADAPTALCLRVNDDGGRTPGSSAIFPFESTPKGLNARSRGEASARKQPGRRSRGGLGAGRTAAVLDAVWCAVIVRLADARTDSWAGYCM